MSLKTVKPQFNLHVIQMLKSLLKSFNTYSDVIEEIVIKIHSV